MNEKAQSIEFLWQDYLFITKEITKFIEKQDIDLFVELIKQRDNLQVQIEEQADKEFLHTSRGLELYNAIATEEQHIKSKLACLINASKRQNQISNAYEGLAAPYVGYRMDRQT